MQIYLPLTNWERRCNWMGWWAILHLQLEHADAVESQDFWHVSHYKHAIKDALGISAYREETDDNRV